MAQRGGPRMTRGSTEDIALFALGQPKMAAGADCRAGTA